MNQVYADVSIKNFTFACFRCHNTLMSKSVAASADNHDVTSSLLQLMCALRQDAARTFDPLGFRTMQTLLLGFVEGGYTQPKELAGRLGTVPPAVSALITDLEERGLLAREGDPSDGRRVRLRLTGDGEKTLSELRASWQQTSQKRLGTLSDAERAVFTQLCQRLLDG